MESPKATVKFLTGPIIIGATTKQKHVRGVAKDAQFEYEDSGFYLLDTATNMKFSLGEETYGFSTGDRIIVTLEKLEKENT